MNDKPRHRWFVYSLRTMLVLVTAVACWLGYAMNWIRQRREFLATHSVAELAFDTSSSDKPRAPGGLWLFGEPGREEMLLVIASHNGELQLAESLFPETKVSVFIYPAHRVGRGSDTDSPSDELDSPSGEREGQPLPSRDRQALINDLE